MRLLVAIPALNEAATVAAVIADIHEAVTADVVVIDDDSSDSTAAKASAAGAQVLKMPFNVGVGGAMRTAFRYAQRNGYDAVVQVDGDGQHDPAQIPALLDGLQSRANVVVGSRFAKGYSASKTRRLAMKLLAWGASRITGVRLTDTTSGFRAADRQAIELFARRYPVEYLGDTTESLVVAARAGLTVAEVPVQMRPRQGGSPSQGPVQATLYLGRVVLALAVAAASAKEEVRA